LASSVDFTLGKESSMTQKSNLVIGGWLELTDQEKREVLDAINEYYGATFSQRSALHQKSFSERNLGPVSALGGSICPCCHKAM
jgi:hypothetical protein